MSEKKRGSVLFSSRAKSLEMDIEQFLSWIDESAMLLGEAVKKYLDGDMELFAEKVKGVDEMEKAADELRRQIKRRLYTEMLIPDSRGDVLGLLETTDNIADVAKRVAGYFSTEKPEIFPFLIKDFRELTEASLKAVQELTLAIRAFFTELYRVTEHLDKVHFWEHQADEIEDRLKRKAFDAPDIDEFSKRVHMRFFAERISLLADEAEAVAERLAISAIKRTL
jgi:predicted phosphate transport protein (TIGR00153 family)